MPHIRMRGLREETAAKLSIHVQELANLIQTDPDNFTFERISTQFFVVGKPSAGSPFVEVMWFARSPEMKQALVDLITRLINTYEPSEFVTIIFVELGRTSYFENGRHF